MGRDSEDKAGRILSIYTRLKQGKVIYKQEESIWEKIIAKGTDTWLREGGEGYVNENGNETVPEV